jgi:predicted ribosome quality control (RQC) complex YloA/Tae2 family protein
MRDWYSPLPLTTASRALLSQAGLQRWLATEPAYPQAGCLLLYDTPDLVLRAATQQEEPLPLTANQLTEAYRELRQCSERTGQLQQLSQEGLQRWLADGDQPEATPDSADVVPATAEPLITAATLSLIETDPQLLTAYTALELRAQLLGREPDLQYRARLLQAIDPGALLQSLRETLQNAISVGAVQQAQQSAHQIELQNQRQQFESQLATLQQQLESSAAKLFEAREEADLTLQQLHQVQEELEHYFLLCRGQNELLSQYGEQQLRVQKLLARTVLPNRQDWAGVAPRP